MDIVPADSPEYGAQQAHIDRIYARSEALQDELRLALAEVPPPADADEKRARLLALESSEQLCYGRMELLDGEYLYIGRLLLEEGDETLVVNWQAPAAEPFFRAHSYDVWGLRSRLRFRLRDRRLVEMTSEDFDPAMNHKLDRGPIDRYIADFAGHHGPKMQAIAQSLSERQYDIIKDSHLGPVLIVGGPGSGKTGVGLHRLADQIWTSRDSLLGNAVVIGPNDGYLSFISNVLPALGHAARHFTFPDLIAEQERSAAREEPPDIGHLKGDPRMARVLERMLRQRRGEIAALTLQLRFAHIEIEADEAKHELARLESKGFNFDQLRREFRRRVADLILATYLRRLRAERRDIGHDATELRQEALRDSALRRFTDRILPPITPEGLITDLLTNAASVAAAAARILREDELEAIRRDRDSIQREGWSVSDLALLDEARSLIEGAGTPFGHVLVDEVQDLTPMQLRAIARRSPRRLTALGDLAQASGDWEYQSWDEVAKHLTPKAQLRRRELKKTYRVPSQIMELAIPVLRAAAPTIPPPEAIRLGTDRPSLIEVDSADMMNHVVSIAADVATEGTTGIIVPEAYLHAVLAALTEEEVPHYELVKDGIHTGVTVVRSIDAKGLEFENVVVVEPSSIAYERPSGLRTLYVALTRSVRRLRIVYSEPLPPSLLGSSPDRVDYLNMRAQAQPETAPSAQAPSDHEVVKQLQADEIQARLIEQIPLLEYYDLMLLHAVVERLLGGEQEGNAGGKLGP